MPPINTTSSLVPVSNSPKNRRQILLDELTRIRNHFQEVTATLQGRVAMLTKENQELKKENEILKDCFQQVFPKNS